MKKTSPILNQICHLLILMLWIYASLSKILNFELSKGEMLNQVFPHKIALVLAWLVPAVEMSTAVLILIPGTTLYGYRMSLSLLSGFTIYIILGLLNLYNRMPCTCGEVISQLSWGEHLVFNFFFLALTLTAIIINHRERKLPATSSR